MNDLPDLSPAIRELIAKTNDLVAQHPASEVTEIPDDGDYDFRLTDQKLLDAQVCTRRTDQEAADWLTTVRPPGTEANRWYPSDSIAPVACAQFQDTHRHVIVEC